MDRPCGRLPRHASRRSHRATQPPIALRSRHLLLSSAQVLHDGRYARILAYTDAERGRTTMPELPEVEYLARQLREALIGSRIMRVEVLWPRAVSRMTPEELIARLTGRRVLAVGRRAKYLVLTLDSGESLVIHRRMSGNLRLARAAETAPYTRVAFTLSNGRQLLFTDPRKFGRITVAAPEEL